MTTDKGVRVSVRSRFWFGAATTTAAHEHQADGRWVTVQVEFSGETTLTNEATTDEGAAGSVLYEYNAGWAATSPTCRHLRPGDGPAAVHGGYCWRRLGSASLLDPRLSLLHRLQPREQQTIIIAADPAPGGLSLDVPSAQIRLLGASLRRPDVLVVTTSDALRDNSRADALRGACEEKETGPTVAGQNASTQALTPAPNRHLIVAASESLTCGQLPPLSN